MIANEVEKRISGFLSQPPVVIRDTAFGVWLGIARNDNGTGAIHEVGCSFCIYAANSYQKLIQ